MKRALLLVIAILICTGLAAGFSRHDEIDLADFNNHPDAYDGRLIQVSAQVIAVNADGKSLELFDSQSRTSIQVRLTGLRKSERSALLRSEIRRVAVSGRAAVVEGRLIIEAQRIEPLPPLTAIAKHDTAPQVEEATVNVVN